MECESQLIPFVKGKITEQLSLPQKEHHEKKFMSEKAPCADQFQLIGNQWP